MIRFGRLGTALTMTMLLWGPFTPAAARTRVIATTDGEIDDRCSMIRFLLYANEWDIRGLIHSSSMFHWLGDAHHARHDWADVSWLDRQLDAYEQVYPSLRQHDPDYPTPDYLRSQVFVGNINYEGDMDAPTPGSRRIVEVLLDPDPSPVWLQAWGGANTIARALKTIAEEHPDRMDEVTSKARLYLIMEQDKTLRDYILKAWPGLFVILDHAFPAIAYDWRRIMTPEQQVFFDGAWMKANLLEHHGPLCAMYEAHSDGRFRSEGDSPAFMHLIDVGLAAESDPSWGGWGGRFVRKDPLWVSAPERYESILRWAPAFQRDWAGRADWCVKPPAEANHRPTAVLNGDTSQAALVRDVDPGASVRLSAAGSTDRDGNQLAFHWSVDEAASSFDDSVPLTGAESHEAILTVPDDAAGRTIHVLLEVTDDGDPALSSYRRVVLNVSGEPVPTARERRLQTPVTQLAGPPAATGPWVFHQGVNLNGPALTIDGHAWDAGDVPNLTCQANALASPNVALLPPTDEARAAMIHRFRWGMPISVRLTAVPEGTYAVYVYLWEDNNSETVNLMLNGELVARGVVTGAAGEWQRLGPFTTLVTNGTIELTGRDGAVNLSGLEIWRRQP